LTLVSWQTSVSEKLSWLHHC